MTHPLTERLRALKKERQCIVGVDMAERLADAALYLCEEALREAERLIKLTAETGGTVREVIIQKPIPYIPEDYELED